MTDVLMTEAMAIVDGLLDGTHAAGRHRSVFSKVPVFRTNFWPAAAGVAAGLGALAVGLGGWVGRRSPRGGGTTFPPHAPRTRAPPPPGLGVFPPAGAAAPRARPIVPQAPTP